MVTANHRAYLLHQFFRKWSWRGLWFSRIAVGGPKCTLCPKQRFCDKRLFLEARKSQKRRFFGVHTVPNHIPLHREFGASGR
eukprot:3953440-Amphidinium_carterae.1